MRVGVGLPAAIPGADPRLTIEWARRADDGPFSSVGVIDRIVYDCHECMAVMAAAAAVTSRVRLATTIAIAPIRNTAVLAKEAATVHALSGGRFVFGVGLGGRADDYEVAEVELQSRGRRMSQQRVRSMVRDSYADAFRPSLQVGRAKYIWLGTDRLLDSFTFIFR